MRVRGRGREGERGRKGDREGGYTINGGRVQ